MLENKENLAKKSGKGFLKFLVGLIMLLIFLGYNFFVIGCAVFEFWTSNMDIPVTLGIGIGCALVYAAVVFIIPYLRSMKNSVRWWAYLAIGDAI